VIKFNKILFVLLISLFFLTKGNTEIKDGLFATVGNRAITDSDVVNEVKLLLILNNESYSEANKDTLHKVAISSIVKRNIKKIEINKNKFLQYNQKDLYKEVEKLAYNINVDVETLKNICASNEIDFSLIEDQIKTELLWNSLIFHFYKDRLSINIEEINDQLKLAQNKKKLKEYLISEIIAKPIEGQDPESQIEFLKNKIETEGFEKVAMDLSITESSIKGGNLGWLNENELSKRFKKIISNTSVGNLSEAILLPEGILIFKVRNKREVERNLDLEVEKNQIVHSEKTKILNMYSLSHYDKLRRSVAVKFYNE
tara:strand:+ start:1192 stop:2133 length:942 start_codon:yes stop_codon:yes gene_type:complete